MPRAQLNDMIILCVDLASPMKTDADQSWTITIGESYILYFWCYNYNFDYCRPQAQLTLFMSTFTISCEN